MTRKGNKVNASKKKEQSVLVYRRYHSVQQALWAAPNDPKELVNTFINVARLQNQHTIAYLYQYKHTEKRNKGNYAIQNSYHKQTKKKKNKIPGNQFSQGKKRPLQ